MKLFLTKGYRTIIDDDSYEIVGPFHWHAAERHGHVYAKSKNKETGERLSLHRMLVGAKKGQIVDHINGDTLDNRLCNLRFVSASQNQGNRRKKAATTSEFKGVCWSNTHNRWVAYIRKNNKMKTIGLFKSEVEAARAYDREAQFFWGDYSLLNFPLDCVDFQI